MADMDILDIISALAPVLGGAAKANQGQNNFEDITKQSAWDNFEQNRLARDKFAAAAPGQRLATSNRASMTKNFTPTKVSFAGKGAGKAGLPFSTFSGGAAGAARDPRSSEVANSVLDQELQAQMKGAAGGDSALSKQPTVGDESLGSKLLGGSAAAASALDAIKKAANGGGGDVGKLLSQLFRGHGMNPDTLDNSSWLPSYDPFGGGDLGNFGGSPTDPSKGTGVGPGMQSFYDWLAKQTPDEKPYDPYEFGDGGGDPAGDDATWTGE